MERAPGGVLRKDGEERKEREEFNAVLVRKLMSKSGRRRHRVGALVAWESRCCIGATAVLVKSITRLDKSGCRVILYRIYTQCAASLM